MKSPFLLLALFCSAALTGCINIGGWRTVHGSGNVITESREVSQFDRVSISGSGELIVAQGVEESLTVEADDNLQPLIQAEVIGGILSIGPQNVYLRPTRQIRYRLQVKHLAGLDLSGSVRAEAGPLKAERLGLNISGSGNIHFADLEAQSLSANISGSGTTAASGHVERQQIQISGSGNHEAPRLKCAQLEAHISGSGHASVWVVESLTAHISGSGGVEYRGTPRVKSHLSGSGRVHRVGGED